jgi:hypothetical protein
MMTYATEDFVRRAVNSLLRHEYAGKFVCAPCLVTLLHERMHRGWRKSEIERAMPQVFQSPGALTCSPTMVCAIGQKTASCLGALRP